jgi:hypothetical protein
MATKGSRVYSYKKGLVSKILGEETKKKFGVYSSDEVRADNPRLSIQIMDFQRPIFNKLKNMNVQELEVMAYGKAISKPRSEGQKDLRNPELIRQKQAEEALRNWRIAHSKKVR